MPLPIKLRSLLVVAAALLMTASCGRKRQAAKTPPSPRVSVAPVMIGDVERGIASWYGDPYHGRRSANGEVYDMHQMTAAHRTMPFGTWVKVDNETNGKSTKVRITDRGPFVGDRVIDLSRKAAEEISLIGPGTAKVRLTVIDAPDGEVVEKYGVQVAAWEDKARAEEFKKLIAKQFGDIRIVEREGKPVLYRVIVGSGTREQADEMARRLRQLGHTGFVTRHVP